MQPTYKPLLLPWTPPWWNSPALTDQRGISASFEMFSVNKATPFLFRRSFLSAQLYPINRAVSQFTRMVSSLPRLPIFEAIASHNPSSTVVVHSPSGRRFTYGELLGDVAEGKDRILSEVGGKDTNGERIAFLVENSYDYVGGHQLCILTRTNVDCRCL